MSNKPETDADFLARLKRDREKWKIGDPRQHPGESDADFLERIKREYRAAAEKAKRENEEAIRRTKEIFGDVIPPWQRQPGETEREFCRRHDQWLRETIKREQRRPGETEAQHRHRIAQENRDAAEQWIKSHG
jgi:hypothetical protein